MALRSKDDTPSPLLAVSRTSEEDVLDSFKAEIAAKQAGTLHATKNFSYPEGHFLFCCFCLIEKEKQRQSEKARKEDERRRDERKKLEKQEMKNKKLNQLQDLNNAEALKTEIPVLKEAVDRVMAELTTSTSTVKPRTSADKAKLKIKEEVVKKEKAKEMKLMKEEMNSYTEVQGVHHIQERPKVAHAQNHQIGHSEPVSH